MCWQLNNLYKKVNICSKKGVIYKGFNELFTYLLLKVCHKLAHHFYISELLHTYMEGSLRNKYKTDEKYHMK